MNRPVRIFVLCLFALSSQAAIVRTAKGTATSKVSGTTVALAAVTIAAGAHIVVMAASTRTPDPGIASATWGANSLAFATGRTAGGCCWIR
jgi:hypothetical protein